MRRGLLIVLLGLTLGALAALYDGRHAVPPPAPSEASAPHVASGPPEASGPLAELRWVRQGSRVLVDQRWLWDPEGGTFTALPFTAVRPVEGGGEEWLNLAFSRDGTRVAVWDAQAFHVGTVEAALAGPFPLPFPQTADEEEAAMRARLLFWNGRDELLGVEQRFDAEARSTCARFAPSTRTWQRVETCPRGLFLRLTQVEPGPGGWLAVFSEAEGSLGFQLLRLSDGPSPPEDSTPLRVELPPEGALRTGFSRDGTRLVLTTPCELERAERPCEGVEDGTPWRLYTWELARRRLKREREGLPQGVVVSEEGRLAWSEPGQVCMSESPEVKHCQPLPPVPWGGAQRAE